MIVAGLPDEAKIEKPVDTGAAIGRYGHELASWVGKKLTE